MSHPLSREAKQLQRTLRDWLGRNHLDYDCRFLTGAEWRTRGEELLVGAEFVVITEGGLCRLLNYAYADPRVEELQDLCESFGYWFELGHVWSIGFYRDDSAEPTPRLATYKEKLRDPRWRKKASLVKQRAGHRCQDCGTDAPPLHAHHCWYKYGLEPWQYPLDTFRCLCEECHTTRHETDHRFRTLVARFTSDEAKRVRTALERLFHWYDRAAVLAALDALGPDEGKLLLAVNRLIQSKTEPGAT